jgi:cyclase
MLKKRLIFTLLHNQGQFMLSRNFRLQKVGDLRWLQKNYNFSHISFSIDELIVLDVTRDKRNIDSFCRSLRDLTQGCFVPIAAGGGVRSVGDARALLRSGADKVVINTPLYSYGTLVEDLAGEFGQQCIVASVDVKSDPSGVFKAWSDGGTACQSRDATVWLKDIANLEIGEIYLNSIDRDGTGQGYDFRLLDLLPTEISKPIILAGGVGNAKHLVEGFADSRVDAVATANLFNFVGDGLKQARQTLIANAVNLPFWDVTMLESIRATS